MKKVLCLLSIPALLMAADQKARDETAKRLGEAATVFTEIMGAQDRGIPQDLLDRAQCIVIVPAMKKGAFIVGAQYGKGFLSCRNSAGTTWSAPAALRLEGGSVGFQIGGSETDIVMLVMNQRGEDKLLSSQFTLGGEGELAAGPVGRTATAETDAQLTAEMLSWSRSKGVFAGVALKGMTLRQDTDDNEAMYDKRLDNREIVTGTVAPPAAAQRLMDVLKQHSPRAVRKG